METKHCIFTRGKQGLVLHFRVPKTSSGRCFLAVPKARPHAMVVKPGQRPSATFSVPESRGSVLCWWTSESGSMPRFGDQAGKGRGWACRP